MDIFTRRQLRNVLARNADWDITAGRWLGEHSAGIQLGYVLNLGNVWGTFCQEDGCGTLLHGLDLFLMFQGRMDFLLVSPDLFLILSPLWNKKDCQWCLLEMLYEALRHAKRQTFYTNNVVAKMI